MVMNDELEVFTLIPEFGIIIGVVEDEDKSRGKDLNLVPADYESTHCAYGRESEHYVLRDHIVIYYS
jgi:hypothetical protein